MPFLSSLVMAVDSSASSYRLVSALFLRLLALIYLAAFASIGVQIAGLVGADGILPFSQELTRLEAEHGAWRFLRSPQLFWLDASDTMLRGVALAGILFSLFVLFNLLTRLSLICLFILYLSLFHAGQIFMFFQWDFLLLEAGFLAIFLPSGSRLIILLYRWLLFRLRFLSGVAKLLTQDPSWANLTALVFYFETQPLPHVGAWYAHQLPDWLLRVGTGATLAVEIVVPFMMFMPRRWRLFAAWATLLMQVLILLTSNHNFFNLLTIVLCLFLFDDQALYRVVPRPVANWLTDAMPPAGTVNRTGAWLRGAVAVLIVGVSASQMYGMLSPWPMPEALKALVRAAEPFRVASRYHVFPTMFTERVEIVIEGSLDGQQWQPYVFRYKPGPLDRRPPVVIPHQPRLDWEMWFLQTGHPAFLPWYDAFLERLLENSPAVTALLERNPFADEPPRFLRASAVRYRFTDPATRAETGRWWAREYLGPFHPFPWLERQAGDVAGDTGESGYDPLPPAVDGTQ